MTRTWLAGYPRSGNMFLRLLLWHGFGQKSDSQYPKDIEADFQEAGARFCKTHGPPVTPAIYVIRDGREVCVSYWHYLRDTQGDLGRHDLSLADVIRGQQPEIMFGNWSNHIRHWQTCFGPDVLVVHYEDMLHNPGRVIRDIATWTGLHPTGDSMSPFSYYRDKLPEFFRSGTNETWRDEMTGSDLDLFWSLHGDVMREFAYERI